MEKTIKRENSNKFFSIKGCLEIIAFLEETQINHINIYDLFTDIFNKTLKPFKDVISRLRKEYNQCFQTLYIQNQSFFEDCGNKLEFCEFYKLCLTKAKFYQISSIFMKKFSKIDPETIERIESEENDNKEFYHKINRFKMDLEDIENKKERADVDQEESVENRIFRSNEIFILILSLCPIQLAVYN
jgi:hypothetical protein